MPGDELRGRVDVLAVNAPYVPTADIALMPPEARDYEHRVALDGGDDGLDVQRRVVDDATTWLSAGGHLLIETSVRQAPVTLALFSAAGLDARIEHSEEYDATVAVGLSPAQGSSGHCLSHRGGAASPPDFAPDFAPDAGLRADVAGAGGRPPGSPRRVDGDDRG